MISRKTQTKLGRMFVELSQNSKAREIIKQAIQPKPHKYGAKAVVIDGIRFASKREARRYAELKLLAKAGEISNLQLQPEYVFETRGVVVFSYFGDFEYYDNTLKRRVVEDVKGVRTPVYRLKKKIIEAEHDIEIREV